MDKWMRVEDQNGNSAYGYYGHTFNSVEAARGYLGSIGGGSILITSDADEASEGGFQKIETDEADTLIVVDAA